MNQSWTTAERKQAIDEALKRAVTDSKFRSLIKTDPRAALTEIAGMTLPATYRIRVLERDGYDATIVLPEPVSSTGELSDTELERVAGGRFMRCEISCATATME
jgi:hypothetical protein